MEVFFSGPYFKRTGLQTHELLKHDQHLVSKAGHNIHVGHCMLFFLTLLKINHMLVSSLFTSGAFFHKTYRST